MSKEGWGFGRGLTPLTPQHFKSASSLPLTRSLASPSLIRGAPSRSPRGWSGAGVRVGMLRGAGDSFKFLAFRVSKFQNFKKTKVRSFKVSSLKNCKVSKLQHFTNKQNNSTPNLQDAWGTRDPTNQKIQISSFPK